METKKLETEWSGKVKELVIDGRSLKQRLFLILPVNLFFAYTLLVFAPYELFIANMDFLSFTFQDVWGCMLLLGICYVLAATALCLCLRGKLLDYFLSAVFAFVLCAYLQGNFFNQDRTILNGGAIAWHNHKREAFGNSFLWLVLFSLPYWTYYFSRKIWENFLKFGSYLFIAMQAVALVFLLLTTNFDESVKEGYLSSEKMFQVSSKENVILFILDEFDKAYLDEVLEESPDYLAPLGGFTEFTNHVSAYFRTYPSIPYMLTKEKYFCDIPSNKYIETAWENGGMMASLDARGFDIEIYSDRRCIGAYGKNMVDNYVENKMDVSYIGVMKGMLNLVFYRNMPYIAKPTFWLYTGDLNTMAVGEENSPSYTIDDALFYVRQRDGLTLQDENSVFKFYHLNGTHEPYMIDSMAQKVVDGTKRTEAAKGSLKIVYDYIEQMKKLGIFENSLIIITADHGKSTETSELKEAVNPILFIKPKGKDAREPLVYSKAPTADEDLHATILKELGVEGYEQFGTSVFDIQEGEQRKRYKYFQSVVEGREKHLYEYVIEGDAKDFSNWSLTGKSWPIQYNFYLW